MTATALNEPGKSHELLGGLSARFVDGMKNASPVRIYFILRIIRFDERPCVSILNFQETLADRHGTVSIRALVALVNIM